MTATAWWRDRWTARRASKVALTLGVLAVCSPAVVERYAWSDDYVLLAASAHVGPSVADHVLSGGRPILAVALHLSYLAAGSIAGLASVRLLGIIGIALVALVVHAAASREGLGPWPSAGLGFAVVMLPPFQVYAAWSGAWPFGWAAALAGYASLCLLAESRRTWARTALLVAFLAACVMTYQPAAMFAFVPLAVRLALRPDDLRDAVRRVRDHVLVVAGGAVAGLALGRLAMTFADVPLLGRSELATTIPLLVDKVEWFASRLVVIGARPYSVASPSAVVAAATAVPVLLVLLVGLYLRAGGSPRERVARVALALTLVPLSVLPNLVVSENQFEFRVVPAMTAIFLVYLVAAVDGIWRALPAPTVVSRVPAMAVLLPALVVVGAWTAVRHNDDLFVSPSVAKDRYLASVLRDYDPAVDERIEVVVPLEGWGARPRLGVFSTTTDLTHPWVPVPDVQFVLRARGIEVPQDRIEVVRRPSGRSGTFVVDTRPLVPRLAP